jgi:hypothetical protein
MSPPGDRDDPARPPIEPTPALSQAWTTGTGNGAASDPAATGSGAALAPALAAGPEFSLTAVPNTAGVPPPAPGYERFDTLAQYWAAFDQTLERARRSIGIFDVALSATFDRPARIDLLRAFLAADHNNRLRIVLHDAQSIGRDCPRLCGLLRQFSEAVAIHQTTAAARAAADPLLVVDDRHALRRFHHTQQRSALCSEDPVAARALVERFEQIFEASEPALSATVLGL